MNNFKDYITYGTLLESVYSEIESELTSDVYEKFTDLPTSRALKDNHRMLLQVYIAALIVGVSKDEIETNPKIMFEPEVKDLISRLMTETSFSTDFANLTIDFLDDDYMDIESEKTQRVIESLTNQYGEIYDKKYTRAYV